tara:strand:+ start:300 stop:716 length:417 start_codon:yes stop_codon:yes gene_type:complete
MPFMTVLPVVLILVLRLYENSRSLKQICIETTLFLIVIALHICLDLKQISAEHFYQMIAIIIALMIFMARESKSIIILLGLPFILSGFVFYCIGCFILNKEQPSVESLTEKYNRFVEIDDLVLSLDGSEIEENWDEKL